MDEHRFFLDFYPCFSVLICVQKSCLMKETSAVRGRQRLCKEFLVGVQEI